MIHVQSISPFSTHKSIFFHENFSVSIRVIPLIIIAPRVIAVALKKAIAANKSQIKKYKVSQQQSVSVHFHDSRIEINTALTFSRSLRRRRRRRAPVRPVATRRNIKEK